MCFLIVWKNIFLCNVLYFLIYNFVFEEFVRWRVLSNMLYVFFSVFFLNVGFFVWKCINICLIKFFGLIYNGKVNMVFKSIICWLFVWNINCLFMRCLRFFYEGVYLKLFVFLMEVIILVLYCLVNLYLKLFLIFERIVFNVLKFK